MALLKLKMEVDATPESNYMKQSPSLEANSHSAHQEIPCPLQDLKVHYHIHKSLQMAPLLGLMNPVQTLPLYFFIIHFNIILPSMPRLPKWSLPLHFLFILFILYLTTLFQYLRLYSIEVRGKPAASAQFLLNSDSSAEPSSSKAGDTWVRNMAAEF
jgi:hypothetical protein